ncbi:guanine deaminase [Edwardsiella ictaluri]|uniref:Guanine deaminase n=2 Tax=Edwardsiella ictaluri TaxID=67780 RepID=C5BEY3_EDWI9|nr:guanine deaminase [Edwardsiella ictaluri]ACR70655.1 guanine deaminase, putative [Edwardsiella ictaluri 93-146]EKS7761751.1 guanine deaminase [Edwardsiella ictaluri]EKS7770005.1 guanine deaminase [Edwardsiella ictaluri]EKS7773058.1 guanine deaminase [Edwardsiella ictaluri]EKS7775169.1 guanine deaminase [Edwardsiella ictaluri]
MVCEHTLKAVRGSILDVTRTVTDPQQVESALRFIEDGLLLIRNGKVDWCGSWEEGRGRIPASIRVRDYRGKLIVPGFVDTHIHYPQSEMVGAYGEQLLEWLNKHTFPTEQRYNDLDYAREMSNFFLKQLLRNGTTTALVFGTVHPESVDALFEAASHINMRMIAGKVMMDRNAPDYLLDDAQSSYEQSKALIERWHKNGRLLYAVTPRFAPTSSPEQLAMAQRLREEYPDTYLHTHLCENRDEIAWVKSLYPHHDGYLDVYHQYGLTGKNCVFAHCIHLEEKEWDCLSDTGSSIAFCPTSNLYLGSGLFNLQQAWRKRVKVGMGTDIGAGTTFNMLQTLNEAYKVMQLQGCRLSAYEAFYLATLGGAASLGLDDRIGNFLVGKEADFVVLEPTATPLQQLRYDNSVSLVDKLFVTMTLGDDRTIYRTYVDGRLVYERT